MYICVLRDFCVCTSKMAQRALAQELLCPDGGPSCPYYLALAQVQMLRGEYSSAEATLQQAHSINVQVCGMSCGLFLYKMHKMILCFFK